MTLFLLSNDAKKARYQIGTLKVDEEKSSLELLREVGDEIVKMDDLIATAISTDQPHAGMDALKNELWYFKYQLLEQF